MADGSKPGWFQWIFGNGPLQQAAKQGSAPAATPAPDAGIDIAKMAQDQADAAKKAQPAPKVVPKADSNVHSMDWRRGNLNQ